MSARFATAAERARVELEDARRRFIGDRPRATIAGRAAILVDDGVATGATARAALRAIRRRGAKTLTLAVPVASREALADLQGEGDDLVCLQRPPVSTPSARSTPTSARSRTTRPSRFLRAFSRPRAGGGAASADVR